MEAYGTKVPCESKGAEASSDSDGEERQTSEPPSSLDVFRSKHEGAGTKPSGTDSAVELLSDHQSGNESTSIDTTGKCLSPTNQMTTNAAVANQEGPRTRPKRHRDARESSDVVSDSAEELGPPPKKMAKNMSPAKPKLRLARRGRAMSRRMVTGTSLTRGVLTKIENVKAFVDARSPSNRIETGERGQGISVTEHELVAILMTMSADYQLGDPLRVRSADVEDVIIRRSSESHHGGTVERCVFDAQQRSDFETNLHEKIAGHGLESMDLLLLELELFKQKRDGLYQWRGCDGSHEVINSHLLDEHDDTTESKCSHRGAQHSRRC